VFELLKYIKWRSHVLTLWQLGLSLVLLIAATWFYFDKRSLLEEKRHIYASTQYTTEQSEAFQAILQENLAYYNELVSVGYIGTPKRLQWLETLSKLGDRYEIPGIEFTLESSYMTEPYVDPFWHAGVFTRATDMNINLQLTHEGDLYRLFTGLRKYAPGLFSVDSCRLTWLDSYGEESALTRLRGDCQLKWYTLVDGTQKSADESGENTGG